ncbi:MAG: hypothetical protein JWO86_6770, partial [Myxococcaceae bacterium]|nr:hypothetical protein [Myxococcaceae bacterium]
DVRAVHAWGDPTHPLFQEYVAREHLDGGMPVIELHRDHGIPLSAVRRWIATFEVGGRPALTRAAGEANAKAAKRKAAFAAKGAKPEELEALRKMIASRDVAEQRKAYAAIQKRSLTALVPEIVGEVRRKDRAKGAWSIQDELELLSAIGAKEALHELWTSKMKIMRGYGGWMSGLLRKAGCEIKTVERPWSEKYALDGKWWPIKR